MIFCVVGAILFFCSFCSSVEFEEGYPPAIEQHPQSILIAEGSSAQLNCSARSLPLASYQWLKDNEAITELGHIESFSVLKTMRNDSGSYRCLAKNTFGATLSASANISVAYLGQFTSYDRMEISVPAGESLLLAALVLDAFPMELISWEWRFGDSLILQNQTYFVAQDGALVITRTEAGMTGQYSVRATHSFLQQNIVSLPITVSIVNEQVPKWMAEGAPAPYIVLPPKSQQFLVGSGQSFAARDLTLECVGASTRNNAEVQLFWSFNDTAVSTDGVKYSLENRNRRLIVHNPGASDTGSYECEARLKQNRSVSGAAKETAYVQIIVAPLMEETVYGQIDGDLGHPVDLPCRYKAFPHAITSWYFNGHRIDEDLRKPNGFYRVNSHTRALRILNVTAASGGIYQCEPCNAAGCDINFNWLFAAQAGEPPTITSAPNNQSIVAGQSSSIMLKCEVSGSPQPTVSWTLNGSVLIIDNTRYGLEPSGGIRLLNPSSGMSGNYICAASNRLGSVKASAYLSILDKAEILQGPMDQNVVIGSTVVFPCEVSLDKGPVTRQWYFKDQPIWETRSNRFEVLAEGALVIRQVGPRDIGSYTCEITSAAGKQRQSAMLSIIEKPGMPLQVRAKLINDSLPARVEVSWHEGFDGNSAIIKYLAQLRILGNQNLWSDWENAAESRGESRNVSIDNLKPSATYEFRILAVNKYGPGMPSVSSNVITMPQQPPASAPRNVAGSARTSSSIMVQWQPPAQDQWNGDLLGYMIRYRLADYTDIPWLYRNISEPRTQNVLLEELITWREYEIQVAAFNNRGAGVFSKSLYITTLEGVPLDAPSAINVTVLNSTAIRVDWFPPSQQQIPGVNQGYKIEAWQGAIAVETSEPALRVAILPLTLRRMSAIVNGLGKYTAYNITVLCFTTPGDGPRSPPIEIETMEDIPGPVENLHFEEVLFSSVLLVWERPVNANGRLLGYNLTYWVQNHVAETRVTVLVPSNVTQLKIEKLSPSTQYSFEIYASTAVGKGPSRTASIESGVPPELPGPPTGLALANVQSRSVDVQFSPGYDGKTLVSRWLVEALVGLQNTVWVSVFNVSAPAARAVTVTGLRPFTRYRLRLLARNVVGDSLPSEPTESFETLHAEPEYAPQDLSVEPVSSTALKISWTPLQSSAWNGIPKGYMLMYSAINGSLYAPLNGSTLTKEPSVIDATLSMDSKQDQLIKVRIEDPTSSEYNLQFLEPDTVYEATVVAVNDIGQSLMPKFLKAKTFEDVPSVSPSDVECQAESSTALRMRWKSLPRSHRNGVLLGYRIYCVAQNPQISSFKTVDVPVGSSEILNEVKVTGLRPYAEYSVHVSAFTLIGEGPKSQPQLVIRTKEDVPGPPSDVMFRLVSTNEVRLTWKTPNLPNGEITHYAVEYNLNGSAPGSGVRMQLARDLRMFVASGLQPQSYYRFGVSAETSVGFGPEAKVLVFTSSSKFPPTVPGRSVQSPNHPRVSDAVTIAWDVVDQSVAPTRFFVLQVQPANGEFLDWTETIPAIERHYTVKDLKPNTAYRFRVKAVNDFGESRWSQESEWIKTSEAEPSMTPTNVVAVPFGSNTAKVTWKMPPIETWNSDYIGYRILYKEDNASGVFETHELPLGAASESQTEFIIGELSRFKHYLVFVQAFNRQGSSQRSRPAFVYVGFSIPKTSVVGLKAVSLSSSQLKITWTAWNDTAEAISGFKINYAPSKAPNQQLQDIVRINGESGAILKDLYKFTEYVIKVQPFNRAGDGPAAVINSSTLEDRPGQVVNLRFSDILLTSVNVSWDPPKDPNGIVLGYLVTYETFKLEEEFVKKIQEKVAYNSLQASNLEPNVTYTFLVKAETAVGYGPAVSAKVTIGPQPGSPQSPDKPTMFSTDNSLTLEWKNGDQGLSPVTGYIVQYLFIGLKPLETVEEMRSSNKLPPSVPITNGEAMQSSSRTKRQTTSPKWETLTIVQNRNPIYVVAFNSLQPGGVYKFRIIARNEQGVSFPSPSTDTIVVPVPKEPPFYMRWYFVVILALAGVVIIVVIIAVLYITGRNSNEKRASNFSLQLADGDFVTYERNTKSFDGYSTGGGGGASAKSSLQRRGNHYITNPPPRPEPSKVPYSEKDTIPVKLMAPGSSKPSSNFYDSLAGLSYTQRAALLQESGKSAYVCSAAGQSLNSQRRGSTSAAEDPDTSTSTADDETDSEDEQKDISSIAQHYATNDMYRLTWQRAKKEARKESSLVDGSGQVGVVSPGTPTLSSNLTGAASHQRALPPKYLGHVPVHGHGAAPSVSSYAPSVQRSSVASSHNSEAVSGTPMPYHHQPPRQQQYTGAMLTQDARGVITLNNAPGSRAPMPGFSSFV